jgi:uncharacterized DUF497 family protein
VRWTWDANKAAANRVKHGLSFETAVLAFDDPFHASKPDLHPDGDRWHTIGLVLCGGRGTRPTTRRVPRVGFAACDSHLA